MRAAPPVQMTCGRDTRWSAAVAALAALSAATLVAWALWQAAWPLAWRWTLALAAAVPLGGWVWHRIERSPERPLAWNGSAWTLDEAPAHVELMIDLGDWLLLRVTTTADGRAHWLPLGFSGGRGAAPPSSARHLCRAALLAHAGRAA
ncbi:MAG: hypothetical protein QM750_08340 [Rubrivivax sp.]